MIITHIKIYRFSIPMKPFKIATGTMDYAQNILIKVFTDQEIYGIGEGSAFPMIVGETQDTMLLLAKEFANIWKGKNPLAIEKRLQDLNDYIAGNFTCKSAFDMALYDIAAKKEKVPLYKFLSGEKRKILSDITIGIDTPQKMAEQALQFRKDGCSIIKIKLGKNAIEDIERVRKIRQAVGNDMILRLDANQGWSFDDALIALNGMADLDIQFCEQPMRTWYDDLLPDLIKKSAIKIMADESCYNHHDARKLIANKACDYINIKFAKTGGINEALKVYQEAKKENIDCMIGGMLESRLALTAILHYTLACKDIKYYDLDTCLIGHLKDPVIGGLTYNGFELIVNDEIGIGADVNENYLEKCENWEI